MQASKIDYRTLQPITVHAMVKCLSAFALLNNHGGTWVYRVDDIFIAVYRRIRSQVGWLGLRPLGAALRSSNELGELSQ